MSDKKNSTSSVSSGENSDSDESSSSSHEPGEIKSDTKPDEPNNSKKLKLDETSVSKNDDTGEAIQKEILTNVSNEERSTKRKEKTSDNEEDSSRREEIRRRVEERRRRHRSRSYSRSRSRDRRGRSKSRGTNDRSKSHGRNDRSKSRGRNDRSKSRGRNDRSKSRCRNDRSKSRGRNDRSKSRGRNDRSKSRGRNDRSKSRGRNDRSKSRGINDRSKSRGRNDRSKSRGRNERSRSRGRNDDRSRKDDRNDDRSRKDDRNDNRPREDNRNEDISRKDDRKISDVNKEEKDPEVIPRRQQRTVDLLTSKTGGAYIPPAKLRLLQAEITDKSSAAYQRIAWEALKKSIHGYINKVNVDNIGIITRELLKENIVRGRGLICRSIIQAQAASPTFTHVYAALVAVINSKFPNIGELLLKRLVIQFKRGFRRNDKMVCLSASRFIAHLVNQRVAHEILALEILTLLVETPTDDSVEVAIAFLKECGMKLQEVSSKGVNAIFEMLKNILHEGKLDKRVQYMIEVVFQVRKDGFKDHIAVMDSLELVEEDDQFTHLIMLDEATDAQDVLNVFKFDGEYETNENKYKGLSKELLGSDASGSDDGSGSGSGSDSEDDEEQDGEQEKKDLIIDQTETNLVALRRTIYLTIHSSLDYEECAHKLMKMELKPGQEMELCHMFLDCCAEQRTYEKFYGLLAQRFCNINKIYIPPFEEIFKDTYATTHRLDTNRLRNVSKFFAHLLFTDAIGWDVMECIRLNEDDTTSSSRIFIKILFQELAEYMGLGKLNARLKDVTIQESFSGLFPRDNPRNTRFAINFFTSIGLGGLTDELREHLKKAPKLMTPIVTETIEANESDSSDSSTSSSSSSDSSSNSFSSSSSDSSSSSSSSDSSNSSDGRKKKNKKSSRAKQSKASAKNKKMSRKRKRDSDERTSSKYGQKTETRNKRDDSKGRKERYAEREDRHRREKERAGDKDRRNRESPARGTRFNDHSDDNRRKRGGADRFSDRRRSHDDRHSKKSKRSISSERG